MAVHALDIALRRPQARQVEPRRWPQIRVNVNLALGAVLVATVLLAAVVGALAAPRDPLLMDLAQRLQAPGAVHPFGTDQYGRDILSRVLGGASLALSVGLVSVGIALLLGVPLGALAGYYGGWFGEVVMRAMDGLLAFPALLLAVAVVAALGPSHVNAMLAIGLVSVPVFARVARAAVLTLREQEFVVAARSVGGGELYVLWRHVLPNALPPLLVQTSLSFAGAILAEASLSYLGLGTQPPLPSWGRMLEEARNFMDLAPWMAIFPGLAIAAAILGFNLLGDGLRDQLDPRTR